MKKFLEKYNSMSEPVKASLWYTVCNIVNKGIALLATPIFTRVMTEEQYGTFTIFQSWYSIILIFTSLNIFLGGYQKGLILYKNDRDVFTSTQLGLTTLITCIFGVVYIVYPSFWSSIFELPPILMIAMFGELLFMPALEFWAVKERFDFKYKKYVAISIVMTILSLVGGILAVINTNYKVEARVYTDVFSKIMFAGILYVLIFARGKKFYYKKYWKYALIFNIPLLPHYLSNYVLNQSDRIMIAKMIGTDKAAYYSVAYTISTMMLLVTSAINNSLTPFIYKKIDDNEHNKIDKESLQKAIQNTTTPLMFFTASLCLITMIFAPEVIYIFGGKKYFEAVNIVPPVALSVFFIFLYSMFSNIEYYFQKTKFIALATGSSAALNLFLNYIFIKIWGYYAAGYTTLASYICLTLMHYIFYRKIIKKRKMPQLFDVKKILMLSAFSILIMLIIVFLYNNFMARYTLALILIIICIIKREAIMNIIKERKSD